MNTRQHKLKIQRLYHSKPENRKRATKLAKIRKTKIKKLLISRLGNICICCGVTEWWNLTIDHIKPLRRNSIGRKYSSDDWRKISKLKDLSEYQCLCFGCNSSKGIRDKCLINHGDEI